MDNRITDMISNKESLHKFQHFILWMSKNSIQGKKKSHFKGNNWCQWRPDSAWNNQTQNQFFNLSEDISTKSNKRLSTWHVFMLLECRCFCVESRRFGNLELHLIRETKFKKNNNNFKKKSWESRLIYLEELELERERWRLRPGDLERERRRAGDLLLGERDLQRNKTLRRKEIKTNVPNGLKQKLFVITKKQQP